MNPQLAVSIERLIFRSLLAPAGQPCVSGIPNTVRVAESWVSSAALDLGFKS